MQSKIFLLFTAFIFSTLQADVNDTERTKQEITEQLLSGWKSQPQNQPVIVLIGGFPGSGKSQLAKAIQNSYECEIISLDAIRQILLDRGEQRGVGGASFNWEIVRDVYQNILKAALAARLNIILDTNAHSEQILEVEQILKQEQVDKLYRGLKICLDTPYEILVERVRSRQQIPGVHQGTEPELQKSYASKKFNLSDYDIVIDNSLITFEEEWQMIDNSLHTLFINQ